MLRSMDEQTAEAEVMDALVHKVATYLDCPPGDARRYLKMVAGVNLDGFEYADAAAEAAVAVGFVNGYMIGYADGARHVA